MKFYPGILPNFATGCYQLAFLKQFFYIAAFIVENAAFCIEKTLYIKMHNEKPPWRSGLCGVRICRVTRIHCVCKE